jgi:transcription antitermination factor NusG
MPILEKETDLYPANLLDELATAGNKSRRWLAAYTKSRQEKALARQLEAMNVPFYLPLVPHVSVIRGRRVKSLLPLFMSYVFVFADEDERILTLSTQRITQLHCAHDSALMTTDLKNIRVLIESGTPLTVESRLEPGWRVRVKSGALMGMEGTVVCRRGCERLLVAVEFLQQGVSVEISDFQVEPL